MDKYFCSIQDLPREVLRTVLKSDRLVLLSARGNVVPGIQREVRVAAIIEQYLSRHPDQSMEQFLPCLKIWDMDTFVELAGAGTPTAGDLQHFDLSCGHHDQNIVRITARAQHTPGSDTAPAQ